MSETTKAVEPVQYPTIRLGSTDYPIKITCGTLLRLRDIGVDLFEQAPADPHGAIVTQKRLEIAQLMQEPRSETRDEAIAAREIVINAELALASPEFQAWVNPIARGSALDRFSLACKVVAAAIGKTALEVGDLMELDQFLDVQKTFQEALGKAFAQINPKPKA